MIFGRLIFSIHKINSFGYGGANGHLVLDDAYNFLRLRKLSGRHCTRQISGVASSANGPLDDALIKSQLPNLLVWSSSAKEGIIRLASVYHRHFLSLPPTIMPGFLRDLSFTLSEKRSKLLWRSFGIAKSSIDLQMIDNTMSAPTRSSQNVQVLYVFTGQGAQWPGMGRELIQCHVFRDSLEAASSYFKTLGCQWSVIGTSFALR